MCNLYIHFSIWPGSPCWRVCLIYRLAYHEVRWKGFKFYSVRKFNRLLRRFPLLFVVNHVISMCARQVKRLFSLFAFQLKKKNYVGQDSTCLSWHWVFLTEERFREKKCPKGLRSLSTQRPPHDSNRFRMRALEVHICNAKNEWFWLLGFMSFLSYVGLSPLGERPCSVRASSATTLQHTRMALRGHRTGKDALRRWSLPWQAGLSTGVSF